MSNESIALEITPQTRLAQLLQAYPQLEKVLLDLSPAFAKLTHPILRKTIARVATLRQVAEVGGLPLGVLINRLRAEIGMGATEVTEDAAGEHSLWHSNGRVVQRYDARDLLAQGGHPLNQVLSDIPRLRPGELYELITPFVPAPLIDVVRKKGYRAHAQQTEPGLIKTYIALSD